jgi:hypothetical protein
MNAQVRLLEQESTINELRAALEESEAKRERLMDASQLLVELAGQLHMGLAEAKAARIKAEQEAKQLRYERQLLGFARMTLDLIAAGDSSRWDQVRAEAEDIAQRIVDEIGHPVTDEPALGPSFRATIERVKDAIRPLVEQNIPIVGVDAILEALGHPTDLSRKQKNQE